MSALSFVGNLAACLPRALPLLCLTAALTAQCNPVWLPEGGLPGTNGQVASAVAWDADGPGPGAAVVVFGGEFTTVGALSTTNVAGWDPATGTMFSFGPGLSERVWCLAASPAGDLYAATSASFAAVRRWDGVSWQPVGPTFDTIVQTVTVLADGSLVAGGNFQSVGGTFVGGLARWNGTAWLPYGSGVLRNGLPGAVNALLQASNGDLLIGGMFTHIDGTAANAVARWNGSSWAPLGGGILAIGSDGVWALAELPGGDIVAGGFFGNAGGVPAGNISRWDGTAWSALGSGVSTAPPFTLTVNALSVRPNGDLLVGGAFTFASGILTRGIALWNGTAWSPLGPGFQPLGIGSNARVTTLVQLPNGDVIAGGNFASGGGQVGDRLSRWNGSSWLPLAAGINNTVNSVDIGPDGTVWIGGSFTVVGSTAANGVARRGPAGWEPLGSGVAGSVRAVLAQANGGLVVGGDFTSAGGVSASRVARWNGSSWSSLGAGVNSTVVAMTELPNGDLIVAGAFTQAGGAPASRIARWDGSTWSPLGAGITSGVRQLATLADGSVVAAGTFSSAGGTFVTGLARWDGSAWNGFPGAFQPSAVVATRDGRFLTNTSGTVQRWNGTALVPLGGAFDIFDGTVRHLAELPGGDVIAAGDFTSNNGVPMFRIAYWDGVSWAALGSGIDLAAQSLRLDREGALWVGGQFLRAGNQVSAYVARLGSSCPASTATVGSGCPGASGGVLRVQRGAWIGDTFAAQGSGWPDALLVVGVTGFSLTTLPLSAVLPEAEVGCELSVAPDLLDLQLSVAGVTRTSVPIPNSLALIGATFHHQHIPCELDVGGALVSVRATNALSATIGDY